MLTVLFAFLCIIQVSLIAQTLDKTRSQLSSRSTGAINSLTQIDRNLDQLMDALVAHRLSGSDDGTPPTAQAYRTQFEVFWASVTVFSLTAPGTVDEMPAAKKVRTNAMAFLTGNDEQINRNTPLAANESIDLYNETKTLSEQFHNLGHDYFIELSIFSDELKDRTNRLYNTFLLFALLVVTCGGISLYTLFKANRKSIELIEKSSVTQARLTQVVDELRSGKLENKAKDSFIAAASHDLRQPLHALGLFLGALENHIKPTGHAIMEKAQQSSSALNRLLSSLLDLSRLDAGAVNVALRDFDIGKLIGTLEHEFQSTAKARNMVLKFDTDEQLVHTDRILIDRVLRNLIENALTHSRGTVLSVICKLHNGALQITVEDDGIGVPANSQDDIFSEYFQIGNPERDRSKGLGIGLSIVRRLSELLDLDLQFSSRTNQGTRFSVSIPLATGLTKSPKPTDKVSLNNGTSRSILVAVIEDESGVREGMEVMLDNKGYRTVTADSATELLRQLKAFRNPPDVLISDYRLRQGLTGDQAIELVKTTLKLDIPSVIITGDTSPKRVKALTGGGYKLLHKPVEPASLLRVIQKLTEHPANSHSSKTG